jgi:uncharacterized phage protein (TIGR01671 family)
MNRVIEFKRYHFDINGKLVHVSYWGKDINGSAFAMPSSVSTEDRGKAIDCQFTGLLDKNGKKIFEGDTVKLWLNDGWGGKDEYIGKIVFTDGQFMIDNLMHSVYKQPKCDYLPHNCMLLSQPELYNVIERKYIANYGEVFAFSKNAMQVEIIGNLYENPDLCNS